MLHIKLIHINEYNKSMNIILLDVNLNCALLIRKAMELLGVI